MWRWGSDWMWEDGEPPVVLVDRDTREVVRPLVVDETTGAPLDPRRMRMARNRGQSYYPRRCSWRRRRRR